MNGARPYSMEEFQKLFDADYDHVCLYDATRMRATVLEMEQWRRRFYVENGKRLRIEHELELAQAKLAMGVK